MVHQHFMLVPVFDVVEAVALGAETVTNRFGTFDRAAARKRIVELSEQYKLDVDPDAKIESLPVGVRQRVEILKALYRHSDILVLDEPSAVLTPFETEELFGIIRSLTAAGTTVIFITHKLNEVLEVADNVVVLRRGRVAGTADPKTTTRQAPGQPDGRPRRRADRPQGPGRPGRGRPEPARTSRSATTASSWRWTASTSRSAPARSWSSPACRATARPSWSRRSPGSARSTPAR